MKKHLEVGAKSGREEEKESRSSNFLFLLLDLTQQPSHSGQNSKGISEDSKYRRATANQDNIEARALGPIPVK